MNRRNFLMGMGGTAVAAAPRQARNILLLYCEQFQHNVASFAGGPARTPNLEELAAQSVHFSSACTTTGLCSPNRSALFTGRLGHRTGLDDNCHVWHSRVSELDLKQTTLIEWARSQGYFTGYYGKWHLGQDGPIRRGAQRYPEGGFERFSDPAKTQKPDFEAPKRFYDKTKTFLEKPGFYSTERGTYEACQAAQLARQGVRFLGEAAKEDKPFFLTLSFNAVHPPYHVVTPYNSMYDWRGIELPRNVHDDFRGKPAYQADIMWPFHDTAHMSDDDWKRATAFYRGFVSLLDRALGDVLHAVKEQGFRDNTLVVLIADHGDMCGAHNRFDKGPYCYDEIMRIPLLVRAPDAPRRQVSRQVSSIDINRTIAEWAGLKPDIPNVDSRSLLPLISGGDSGWNTPDEAFYRYEWYDGLWFGIRAIRTPEYKYCFNPGGADELYDLRKDPDELTNLAGKPGSRKTEDELARRLLAHLEQCADTTAAARLATHVNSVARQTG
jgi:arylsulfatase A-like enzyme